MTNSTLVNAESKSISELFDCCAQEQISATYSAEDNKLRLRTDIWFNPEQWAVITKMGFKHAPKQDLLVAPRWTPNREDFVMFLAGSITAEQTTVIERAQNKAMRLDALAEKRTHQATGYMEAANRIAGRISNQPIIANHHSERKMLATQKKLERATENAIWACNAVNYWHSRAEAVEHHANRKADFGVRYRRIEVLLKDLRTQQRYINFAYSALALWEKVRKNTDKAIQEKNIRYLTGARGDHGAYSPKGFYDDLKNDQISLEDALQGSIDFCKQNTQCVYTLRWINHILNRLAFERNELGLVYNYDGKLTGGIIQTFLRNQGADKPKAKKIDGKWKITSLVPFPLHIADAKEISLTDKECIELMQSTGYEVPAPKAKTPSILNFKADHIVVTAFQDKENYRQIELTKKQYANIHEDYRCVRYSGCGKFRVKTCRDPLDANRGYAAERVCVFITDSKVHETPDSPSINAIPQLADSNAF